MSRPEGQEVERSGAELDRPTGAVQLKPGKEGGSGEKKVRWTERGQGSEEDVISSLTTPSAPMRYPSSHSSCCATTGSYTALHPPPHLRSHLCIAFPARWSYSSTVPHWKAAARQLPPGAQSQPIPESEAPSEKDPQSANPDSVALCRWPVVESPTDTKSAPSGEREA